MNQPAEEGRNLIPIVAGGVVLLAVLALIIVSVSGSDDEGEQTAAIDLAGSPLPPYNEGADPAIGLPMPEAFGTDFADADVGIKADGTPKAIVFLAHWCGFCQAEVAEMTSYLDSGGTFPEGVEIQSVSTSVDSVRDNYPPSRWLENEGWPYPVLRDDDQGTIATAFGMAGTPFWVFVDGDGNVVSRTSGQQGVDTIVATMEQLTAGTDVAAPAE